MTEGVKGRSPSADRRALFVLEYLVDCNATQAAIRAGYSPHTAEVQGCRLLRNAQVADAVAAGLKEKMDSVGLTVERVRREMARLVFSDLRKLYREDGSLRPITELDDDTAAALAGVEVEELFEGRGDDREHVGYVKKVRLWDKNSAMVTAARHLGMLKDKVEHTGKDGGPIETQDVTRRLSTATLRQVLAELDAES